MVFSSLVFLCIFLPIVFLLHCIIPGMRAKNILLIIASLFFYAYGEPVYVFLMLGSTVFNFAVGRLLGRYEAECQSKIRKRILFFSIVVNLGLLAVFKYTNMVIGTINHIGGVSLPLADLALPIGISFYTFQAMSYIIDVYRGQVEPQKNYLNVLLYISFFPQLIAGPIVKYHDIEFQLLNRKGNVQQMAEGFRRFIIGLSKKVLISNTVAIAADAVFALDLTQLNVLSAWIGAVAYMLQIYYDFSGYSDMAIGLGKMFGFTFQENFRHPYGAGSMQEFWRKWHISLSTWFKEYLYIPLGGNRKGRVRTWINKWVVFFCTGFWHGANWTFVIWGLYHGFFLFIEDLFGGRQRERKAVAGIKKGCSHLYALLVICVGFVLFRSDNLHQGVVVIRNMFAGWHFDAGQTQLGFQQCTPLFLITVAVGILLQFPWCQKMERRFRFEGQPYQMSSFGLPICLLILCILSLSSGTYNPFIYFRF